MTNPFANGMSAATRLVRSGQLTEATALIQRLLARSDAAPSPQPDANLPDADVIDGQFTRLPETETPLAAATPPGAQASHGTRSLRSTLGETLRRIAAGGMPERGPLERGAMARQADHLADGAAFLTLNHRSAHGSRDYRLYVPATRTTATMPLIVMLHGCTQSPEDFAAGTGMNTLAGAQGCIVAYPAQPTGANANKCWNWFNPADQARGTGEPALIAGLVADILRDHPADPARIYVAGLSAGGASAAIMAHAYPDLFSAAGVHSGLPVGAARDVPSAFAAMRSGAAGVRAKGPIPTITFHGTADSTVHLQNGRAVTTQALAAMPRLETVVHQGQSTGGRAYRQTVHSTANGLSLCEHWEIDGAGHAWSGGQPSGSFTDPKGPDASAEMLRFFLLHRKS